jgi:hypothetical protein
MAARTFHALDSNARVFQDDKGRAMTAAEVANAIGWPRFAAELDRPSTLRAGYERPGEERVGVERDEKALLRQGGGLFDVFRKDKDKAPALTAASVPNEVTLLFDVYPYNAEEQKALDDAAITEAVEMAKTEEEKKNVAAAYRPNPPGEFVFELATGYRTKTSVELVEQTKGTYWIACVRDPGGGIEQSAKLYFPAFTGDRLAKQQRVLAIRARPAGLDSKQNSLQVKSVPIEHCGNMSYSEAVPDAIPIRLVPVTEISRSSRDKSAVPLFVGLYVQGPKLPDPTLSPSQLSKEQALASRTMSAFGLARGEFLARLPLDPYNKWPDWNLVAPGIGGGKDDAFPLTLRLVKQTLHRVLCVINTAAGLSLGGQKPEGRGLTCLDQGQPSSKRLRAEYLQAAAGGIRAQTAKTSLASPTLVEALKPAAK